MMLRIGSDLVSRLTSYRVSELNWQTGKLANWQTKKGFTLVEVMVATAVLSLGIVLVYQALFKSLDAFNYCANYISIEPWLGQKLWRAQEDLTEYGRLINTQTGGNFINRNKEFNWALSVDLIDTALKFNLYKINLELFWREGARDVKVLRQAYALYRKE